MCIWWMRKPLGSHGDRRRRRGRPAEGLWHQDHRCQRVRHEPLELEIREVAAREAKITPLDVHLGMVMMLFMISLLTTYLVLFLFLHRFIDLKPAKVEYNIVKESVAVVIAMRNEENRIISCLESINLSHGFESKLHVYLVDDHSIDSSYEKVKERIVEYLAVQQRSSKMKGPIMCLVGPPGVGKTSLGKSVAKATGREFIRISLGGVRDESEIRGHRRTYIGSMPGKIIQALKKAKTSNPLILLDEIDKMGQDFRGDPASAMLEVLDPEQNSTFVDHYLEVEYDLSDVMFLTTSNSYNMPGPLLDRMEIIPLAGYTEDEKHEIAKQHLLPKQTKNHGLKKGEYELTDDGLTDIIRYYTREAGVRNLEREIGKTARKSLTKIIKKEETSVVVSAENMNDFLGVKKYRYGLAEQHDQAVQYVTVRDCPKPSDHRTSKGII